MELEFDPQKSGINARKHGIDFTTAQVLWTDPSRLQFEARFADEERHGLIAYHDNKLWCAIFTIRRDKTRIISVRRARTYEEELYYNS